MQCVECFIGGSRGTGGPDPPPSKITKNIGFLSNTGPDPLKNHKAIRGYHSMFGNHRLASETPFKWRFAGGPTMARFKWHFRFFLPSSTKNKTKTKNVVSVGPPPPLPTKLSGSAHVLHLLHYLLLYYI